MESTFIQDIFTLLTDHIFTIIYFFALVEVYLIVGVFLKLKKHESILTDVSDNLIKGFEDAPDKDSSQNAHEKIQSTLDFINLKIASDKQFKRKFRENAKKVSERQIYNRHYSIEMFASVMSTIVQIFPLLGILGTILAIAQTALEGGSEIDVNSLSSAFTLAMDTTIVGITFSILFMIVESAFNPKIERVITESDEFRKLLSHIYLDQETDSDSYV